MSNVYNFDQQLKYGDKGEKYFYNKMIGKVKYFPGRDYDFYFLNNQCKIELKTDYYDMNNTSNFFLERYSDFHKKTPGGPWQSFIKGVHYYMYLFFSNKIIYIFDNKKLVKELELIVGDCSLVNVYNNTHITSGYKINRELLKNSLFGSYKL